MRYGMNMLLWATRVGPEHRPILATLAETGSDFVELPVFDLEGIGYYEGLGNDARDLGFAPLAVTGLNAEQNICSEDAQMRRRESGAGCSTTNSRLPATPSRSCAPHGIGDAGHVVTFVEAMT